MPNLTFLGLLSTEISRGEKNSHPAYFAICEPQCFTLRNFLYFVLSRVLSSSDWLADKLMKYVDSNWQVVASEDACKLMKVEGQVSR